MAEGCFSAGRGSQSFTSDRQEKPTPRSKYPSRPPSLPLGVVASLAAYLGFQQELGLQAGPCLHPFGCSSVGDEARSAGHEVREGRPGRRLETRSGRPDGKFPTTWWPLRQGPMESCSGGSKCWALPCS